MAWRALLLLVGGLLAGSNLLVLNQYAAQFERFGPARDFTDALFPLEEAVNSNSTRNVWVVDWGMYNTLLMSHKETALLHTGNEPFMDSNMGDLQLRQAATMLGDPDAVFVNHVAGKEVFEGVGARLEQFAAGRGLRKEVVQTIRDSNGRPMFELFRFTGTRP
jgi:hypothetical protein